MFDNIESKIKGIAKAVFVLGVICSVMGSIQLFKTAADVSYGSGVGVFVVYGLVVLVVGSVGAYVISCFVYGFGEMLETVNETAKSVFRMEDTVCKQENK